MMSNERLITLLTLPKLQRSLRSQIQVSCCHLILLFELMSPDNSSSFSIPSVPELKKKEYCLPDYIVITNKSANDE